MFSNAATPQQGNQGGGLFGNQTPANSGGGLFGAQTPQQGNNNSGGLFGGGASTSLFGAQTPQQQPQQSGSLFGSTSNTSGGGLFGSQTPQQQQQQQQPQQQQQGGGLFGGSNTGMFGSSAATTTTMTAPGASTSTAGGLFGSESQAQGQQMQQQQQQQQQLVPSSTADPTTESSRALIDKTLQGVRRFSDVLSELKGWIRDLDHVVRVSSGHEEECENFIETLRSKFVPRCAQLLQHPPRNSSEKDTVSNLDRNAVDVVLILRLAEELELSELEALNLWDCAARFWELPAEVDFQPSSTDTFSVAVELFYYKRDLELVLLLDLIRCHSAKPGSNVNVDLARGIVDELLVNHKLGELMIRRVRGHNERIAAILAPQHRNMASLSIQTSALQLERRRLADAVFILLIGTFATDEETLALFAIVRDMSNRWLDVHEVAANEQEAVSSYESHLVLVLALASALDRTDALYDRTSARMQNKPVRSESLNFIEACEREVESNVSDAESQSGSFAQPTSTRGSSNTAGSTKWKHQGVHGVVTLFWASFIGDLRPEDFPRSSLASKQHRNDVLNQGYKLRGLAYLRGLVRSAEFLQDELRDSYMSILTIFVQKLVTANVETVLGPEMLVDLYTTNSREALRAHEERSNYAGANSTSGGVLPHHGQSMLAGAHGRGPHHNMGGPGGVSSKSLVSDKDASPDTLEDLLGLLRALRVLEPEDGASLWQSQDTLREFLFSVERVVDQDNDPTSLYVSYLGFIGSLAKSRQDVDFLLHRRYNRSTSMSSPLLDFGMLFDVLRQFLSEMQAQQQQQQQQQQQPFPDALVAQQGHQHYMHQQQAHQGYPYQHASQAVSLVQEIMPLADQLVLTCWLEALCSCLAFVSPSEVFGDTPVEEFISIAVAMLRCRLEPALKGQLVRALSLMAVQLPKDRNLWSRLEEDSPGAAADQSVVSHPMNGFGSSSMLSQGGQALQSGYGAPAGFFDGGPTMMEAIRLDLNHSEAVNNVYPLTANYLELIWKLLRDVQDDDYRYLEARTNETAPEAATPAKGPMQTSFNGGNNAFSSNAQGAQPSTPPKVGLLPYLEYVLFEVFLKLDHRKFRDSGEKWRLAAGCLRIFVQILEEYTVDSESARNDFAASQTYSTGFWVMAKLLEGSAFFRQLVDLLQEAGGEEGVRARRESTSTVDLQQYASAMDSYLHDASAASLQQQQQQMSHQQQGPFLLHQQLQQQQTAAGSQGKKPWFVVSSHRANVDVRNSSVSQGDASGAPFGMSLMRPSGASSTLPAYDGGRFASWLSQPHAAGWASALRVAGTRPVRSGDPDSPLLPFYEQVEGKWYGWDDGDLGGRWREHTVRLALRLLKQVSERESWFFEGIHASDVSLESRLERLHRLFTHQKDRLPTVAAFCGYPYSAEMRLNAIELVFRLSEQSPTGSVIKTLRRHGELLVRNLTHCFTDQFNGLDDPDRKVTNFNPNAATPIDDSPFRVDANANVNAKVGVMDLDVAANAKMRKRILLLLIQGLTPSRGNVSELVLGLDEISTRNAPVESIDLRPGRRCCLNAVLDALDDQDNEFPADTSQASLMELMYRLVLLLCHRRPTEIALSYGLNAQRDNFWLRHFQRVATEGPRSDDARNVQCVAWVMNGVYLDLRIARAQILPVVSLNKILPHLFSGSLIRGEMDEADARIREVLLALKGAFSPDAALSSHLPDLVRQLQQDAQAAQSLWIPFQEYYGLTLHKVNESIIRSAVKSEHDEALLWAESRNRAIDLLAARAEVVASWRAIVQLAFVDCREDLIRSCAPGRGDQELLVQFTLSLLAQLRRSPDAHVVLAYPLASLVPTLVAQMRHGDESARDDASANEMALAAATGSYTSAFSRGQQPRAKIETQGLARLSREEQRTLLAGMLEALRSRARMGASADSVSPELRAALYTGICVLINGMRRHYATNLSNQVSQLPLSITEREFLAGAKEFGSDELQELRKRAKSVLDTLHGGERSTILEIVVPDALESESPMARATGLATLKILLECDSDDGDWLRRLRRVGVLRQLLSAIVDRVCADRLLANAQIEKIYELSMTALCTAAQSVHGAQAIVKSDFLQRLASEPLVVLCDKRALDAWAGSMGDTEMHMATDAAGGSGLGGPGEASSPSGENLQERRHDLVLPLLRLLSTLFTTLRENRQHGGNADLAQLQKDVLLFFRVQRRMVSSSLGFPPSSINDIEESSLLLALLAHATRDNAQTVMQELGGTADEFDTLVFDLIREVCNPQPQRGEWKDVLAPAPGPESARHKEVVAAPPDLSPTKPAANASLFQLDVFAQQRRLLQNAIMYTRARRDAVQLKENPSMGRNDSHAHSLILCLDYAAHCLACLSRNSPTVFEDALSEHRKPHRNLDANAASMIASWSQHPQYAQWSCSTLLFVLEGALVVLYARLKQIRRWSVSEKSSKQSNFGAQSPNAVRAWLAHDKLLANHFEPARDKSAIEQLEEVVQSNSSSSQFVHLILRRMRELV